MLNKFAELKDKLSELTLGESLDVFFNLIGDDDSNEEEINEFVDWLLDSSYCLLHHFVCLETLLDLHDEIELKPEEFERIGWIYYLILEQINNCRDVALLEEAEDLLEEIEDSYPDVFLIIEAAEDEFEISVKPIEAVN